MTKSPKENGRLGGRMGGKMGPPIIITENAPHSRSCCRYKNCKKVIERGKKRLSVNYRHHADQRMGKIKYYHPECFEEYAKSRKITASQENQKTFENPKTLKSFESQETYDYRNQEIPKTFAYLSNNQLINMVCDIYSTTKYS